MQRTLILYHAITVETRSLVFIHLMIYLIISASVSLSDKILAEILIVQSKSFLNLINLYKES